MTRTAALGTGIGPGIGPEIGPGIGVLTSILVAGGFALGFHAGNLHNGLIASSFTAVGLFVVRQRPGNREGWLFVATGAAHAVMFAARQYGLHDGPLPGASWIGWLGVWPLPIVLALAGVTVLCFPTGGLPSPAWRPVAGVLVLTGFLLAGVSALWPVEYARVGLVAAHPFALPGSAAADSFYRIARPVSYLLLQLVPAAGVIARLRRAGGDEARQLRWFVYAVVAAAAVMVTGLAVWGSPLPGVLSVPAVAVAAGVAILKYRLYDIDPVINKTLVFGAMATLVTAGYVLVVAGIGSLVNGHGTALSLVATALVAVAFEPLRRRVQRLVDRLVHGHRVTPYEALARLSGRLGTPEAGLLDGMCQAIADGVGARMVVLWTGPAEALDPVSVWPATTPLPAAPRPMAELLTGTLTGAPAGVPVVHDGRFLGAITVLKAPGEALSGQDNRLLGDLAAQAGLILELRANAQRLVAAGDAARRRLERDLHDGVQQHLVTVALELGGLVQQATATGQDELALRAESVRAQMLQATAELREMARGLHPAVLTQDGLEAAIGYLADRSAVPVRLEVVLGRRLPPEIEAMAYFVVSEGLTNAAKHAAAGIVLVRAELTPAGLELALTDDGCGGAAVRPGGGLEGLTDRLTTLGARLLVDSDPSGTRLRTVIPCG